MNCNHCGTQNPDESKLCQNCGAPLTATAPSTGNQPQPFQESAVQSQQNIQPPYSLPQPKKKKKTGCLVAVIIVLVIAILGIIGLTRLPSKKDDSKTPVGANTQSTETQSEKVEKVSIDEQVIFDRNSIKVTVTGLDVNGLFGADINVTIENNSRQNITIQANKCSVNDVMVDPIFSADIAAGKKANDAITLSSSDLKTANITTIKSIEFVLHVFDSDSYETILDSDAIKLKTSADRSYVQTYDDSGFLAYDDSGIKIVVKKLNSSDSFWGSDVYLYVENNSQKDVTIQARNVSINGYMVEPAFSCDVVSGKKAYDTITFFESDLEENNITDISEIELSFHIYDLTSWDDIKDTDPITIKF